MKKIYILIGLLIGSLIFMWYNSHKGISTINEEFSKQDSLLQKYTVEIQKLKILSSQKDTLIENLLKKPTQIITKVVFTDTITIPKVQIYYDTIVTRIDNLPDSLIKVPKLVSYKDSLIDFKGTINKDYLSLDSLNIKTSVIMTSSIIKTKWNNYYLIYPQIKNSSIYSSEVVPFSFKEKNKKKEVLEKGISFGLGILSGFAISKIK